MRSFLEKVITIILLSVVATGIQLLLSTCLKLNDAFGEKLLFAFLACLVCDLYQRHRFPMSACFSPIAVVLRTVGTYIGASGLYEAVFYDSHRSEIWKYWILFCLMLLFEWYAVYVYETRAKRAKEENAQAAQENQEQENEIARRRP